jgi:hypothetical protein
MRSQQVSRRALLLGVAIAMIASTAGFVAAAVLSTTTVTQGASFYQGSNSGANGYGSPSLQVSVVPTAVTTCSTGTTTDSVSGGTATLVLSATTGGTTCTTNDFAEEFTLSFSATVTTQTDTFTVTTQVGAGAVQSNTASLTVGTGTSGAFTATVNVFVDYGAINPPSGGITQLNLVVQ